MGLGLEMPDVARRFPIPKRALVSLAASWPGVTTLQTSQAVTAMLGLAGPIAVGALAGHVQMGMTMALGALALSGSGRGETFSEQASSLVYALTAGGAAMVTGTAMAENRMLVSFGAPAMAGVAGLLGGIHRRAARAATQFMLYTIIAANLGPKGSHSFGLVLLFSLGAAWAAGLSLAARPVFQALRPVTKPPTPALAQSPNRSATRLLRRWRKSLAHLSGWQYALRISLCLFAAGALQWIWPFHHGYWVSITIVIVVQRNLQAALARTLERATGTVLGVLLTSLILLGSPNAWAMVAMIGVLAAARPVLKEANYTAYAAVMTPLVILLLDFGQAPSWAVVADRLVATLAGCALALALGYLLWAKVSKIK
jgi:uncharacterized membrane protein YccC